MYTDLIPLATFLSGFAIGAFAGAIYYRYTLKRHPERLEALAKRFKDLR